MACPAPYGRRITRFCLLFTRPEAYGAALLRVTGQLVAIASGELLVAAGSSVDVERRVPPPPISTTVLAVPTPAPSTVRTTVSLNPAGTKTFWQKFFEPRSITFVSS